MNRSGWKGRAMYFEPGSKPWLLRSLKHYVKDRGIEKAEYRLLSALAFDSTPEGELWWWSLADIEKQAALSNGGAKKSLKGLEAKGILTKDHANRGYPLPDGSAASMSCIIYRLTRKVTDLHGEQSPSAQALNAPATVNRSLSAQTASSQPAGNSVPRDPALSAVPLRPVDPEKNKKEKYAPAHAPDRPVSLREQLKKLSCDIHDDKPIDPGELRKLVAEGIGDEVGLTDEIRQFLLKLEKAGKAELTGLGKIEWTGWDIPTPPSLLLKAEPTPTVEDSTAVLVALNLPKFRI